MQVAMRNPAVWRSGLADSGGQFETLRPGVLVLEEPPATWEKRFLDAFGPWNRWKIGSFGAPQGSEGALFFAI